MQQLEKKEWYGGSHRDQALPLLGRAIPTKAAALTYGATMNDNVNYNGTTTFACPRCDGTTFTPDCECGELIMYCSNPNCTWFCSQGEFDRAHDVVCDITD